MKQTILLVNLPTMLKSSSLKVVKHFSPSGKKTRPVYKYVYSEKYGCPRRVLTGQMDLDAFVQEGADSVDFKSLGKMLIDNKANIIDHFIDKNGEVFDVTGQPRNIHEASKLYNEMHDSFDSLPVELKAVFDNDFNEFSKSYKNGSLGPKISEYYSSLVPASEKEKVKESVGE